MKEACKFHILRKSLYCSSSIKELKFKPPSASKTEPPTILRKCRIYILYMKVQDPIKLDLNILIIESQNKFMKIGKDHIS